jgi:hypothetical protein
MIKKGLFWLLLTVVSTAMAEVSISSSPMVFFEGFGLRFVLPLYGLHILFFGSLSVFGKKTVRFSSLILAGTLFGLYEAYITKVLWIPTWNANSFRILEVAFFPFLVLVFFYHVWMAFILPLIMVEYFTCTERAVFGALPNWLRVLFKKRTFLMIALFYFGLLHGVALETPLQSAVSVFGTSILILGIMTLYRTYFALAGDSLTELLPGQKMRWVLGLLLLGLYAYSLFTIRPESLPGWQGHLVILLAYLGLGSLFWRSEKLARAASCPEGLVLTQLPNINWLWGLSTCIFFGSSVLGLSFLKDFQPVLVVILWGMGIPFGIYGLWLAVRSIVSRSR